MLETIDLSRKVSKAQYKREKDPAWLKLGLLQRRCRELGVPVIIVFEGWDAAGKGTLINELILSLDPRGFSVHTTLAPTPEEALRPFLWRSWTRTPARGRIAIFDRSWYRRVLNDRVDGQVAKGPLEKVFEDIRSFERQLSDDGAVIIKLFLHIAKKEQKKRLDKLQKDPATSWRVTKEDLKRHKQYKQYLLAIEDMIGQTDSDTAPWTVVESHDHRFAALKIFATVSRALEEGIARAEAGAPVRQGPPIEPLPEALEPRILETSDLSLRLTADDYDRKLKRYQKRLRELEYEIYTRRVGVMVIYEGWDAAGKGGNIRRLVARLDPRGYEVVPISAPNDLEKAHHYLWRFWMALPKGGHIAIFDRSWYGRVLVERVEGFATEPQWRRAYHEINEMERNWTNFGCVLVKFWLHIDAAEQLRRFKARQKDQYRQWKITEEDWRNRQKWPLYEPAVEEMLFRTSTPHAPWTIVESNCKWYARVKALRTVCEAIESRLKG